MPGHFIASDWNEPNYYLIDRNRKHVDTIKDRRNPYQWCTDLKPLPGFHIDRFPFYVARTRFTLSLVNLKTHRVHDLIHTNQNSFHPFEKLVIISDEGNKISFVYSVIDYNTQQTHID